MLTYGLRREGAGTLQGQLYALIRADVESGVIAAGERLPSKRALARHLGVSVITVEGAYGQLVAEGYLESRERRGYFAADIPRTLVHGSAGEGLSHATVRGDVEAVPSHAIVRGGAGEAPLHTPIRDGAEGGPSRFCIYRGFGVGALCEGDILGRVSPDARAGTSASAAAAADGGAGVLGGESSAGQKCENTALTCGNDGSQALSPIEDRSFLGLESSRRLVADFSGGAPAEGMFPYASWARTIRRVLADESERSLLAASGPQGSLALRQALAAHLRGFRGMEVDPAQIVVGAGAQTLYHLLVQLLGRGRRFAVEDPGYPRLAATYRAEGVEVAPVALDSDGPSLDALRASGASVLHCMPSHQFPTGLVTTAPRRYELLAWAAEAPGRYLIEDDYDCEFRMAGRPMPSLQGVDGAERVIYLNTFTKSLGAAFRIGYMVLPPHLASAFARDLGFHSCTVGALEQAALARFVAAGDYERHVSRTRTRYRRIRDGLLDALRVTPASERLSFDHVNAGLHFVLSVEGMDAAGQERLVAGALRRGVRMAPLTSYALGSSPDPSLTGRFLMAYGSVREEDVAEAARVIGDECG